MTPPPSAILSGVNSVIRFASPRPKIESLAFHAPKRKWIATSRAIANVGGSGSSRARILFEHP